MYTRLGRTVVLHTGIQGFPSSSNYAVTVSALSERCSVWLEVDFVRVDELSVPIGIRLE